MNTDRFLTLVSIGISLVWSYLAPQLMNFIASFSNHSRRKRIHSIQQELELLNGPLEKFGLKLALYLFLTLTFIAIALGLGRFYFTADEVDQFRRYIALASWVLAIAMASSGAMTVHNRNNSSYKERQKAQIETLKSKLNDKST